MEQASLWWLTMKKNGAAEQWCRSGRFGLLTARNIVYLVAIEANIRNKGEQEEETKWNGSSLMCLIKWSDCDICAQENCRNYQGDQSAFKWSFGEGSVPWNWWSGAHTVCCHHGVPRWQVAFLIDHHHYHSDDNADADDVAISVWIRLDWMYLWAGWSLKHIWR